MNGKKGNRKVVSVMDYITELVDRCRGAHDLCLETAAAYRRLHEELAGLVAAHVGEDRWVRGKNGKAILRRQMSTTADVLKFLELIPDSAKRQALLKLKQGEAEKALDPADWKQIATKSLNPEPTLRVVGLSAKEE